MATQTKLPDANTLLAEYNKSGNLSIEQMLGGVPKTDVISTETINKEKPITVPPPTPPTASTTYDMTSASAFVAPEKTDRQNQQKEDDSRIRDLLSSLVDKPGEALKQQEKAGLFTAREQLGELNKEKKLLDATYYENRKEIEKNAEGKFGGAVQQDLRNLEQEYRDKDYKLAVRTSVANENISTALAISDAYIKAKYEPLQIELDGLIKFSELSKNDLSESESLQLQSTIRQREQALTLAKEKETKTEEGKLALLSSASQQGAPASVKSAIMNAKTLQEAIAAAGEWGGDRLTRKLKQAELDAKIAAIAKIKKEAVSADVPTLTDKISSLEAIKVHPALNDLVGPNGFARMGLTTDAQSFRADVYNLASKEALDFLISLKAKGGTLGALSEKELKILQDSATKLNTWEVKDENGVGAGFWNVKEEDFLAEIDRIEELTNRALTKALGYDPTLISEEDVLAVQQATGEGQEEVNPENYY